MNGFSFSLILARLGAGRLAIAAALASLFVYAFQPAQASWYAVVVGASGADQAVFAADAAAVSGALASGRWKGYNLPGHTTVLSGGGVTSPALAAQLAAINTVMATDTDAVKYLIIYIAGHGGTSVLRGGEFVPPALNSPDEFFVLNTVTADALYDDSLPALITANVPRATNVLFMLDTCKSGGAINGNDPPGDVEQLFPARRSYLIASAREDQNAPLNSILRPNFVNLLNTRNVAASPLQLGQAIGYANLTFTGARRDSVAGESETGLFGNLLVNEVFSSYQGGDDTSGLALVPDTNVIEFSTKVPALPFAGMLALASLLFGIVRLMKSGKR